VRWFLVGRWAFGGVRVRSLSLECFLVFLAFFSGGAPSWCFAVGVVFSLAMV